MNELASNPLHTAYKVIFQHLVNQYCDDLKTNHFSVNTITLKREVLAQFTNWCFRQGHYYPNHITSTDVFDFQRHLHNHLKVDGSPLSLATQRTRLTCVKTFFKWLATNHHISTSPVETMEIPSTGDMLPKAILTKSEIALVMSIPDITTAIGIRDRTILEVLYSTGIRRIELVNLCLSDLDMCRGLVLIRNGKGHRERFVPIGQRASEWITHYIKTARRQLLKKRRRKHLFVSLLKNKLTTGRLTYICGNYIKHANINKAGSCHIFRHTAATQMIQDRHI